MLRVRTAPRFPVRLPVDHFLLAILAAVAVAAVLPAQGVAATVVEHAVTALIVVLFFLYGARLHPDEALHGLRHWRLHLTILGFTYVAFPLLGLALRGVVPWLLPASLYPGLLYVTLVPSTVQSSVTFTSIARGNVAGAIVSASASNLLGVLLTPLLVMAVMRTSGSAHGDASAIGSIVLQLLVPFLVGQLARRWIGDWVSEHRKPLKLVDQGVIVLVVYAAFSEGMREQIWSRVDVLDVLRLVLVVLVVIAVMLALTWVVARRLGFDYGDCVAIQMCGTKKSLATGLPMASVLFAGQSVGLLVLPLMIFHQLQLMACATLAQRYAARQDRAASASALGEN